MIWIAAISLGSLILSMLIAPAFEVKLTKKITNPVLVAALFLALSLMISNAASYLMDRGAVPALGTFSGILGGVGLFFMVLACVRFALSQSNGGQTGSS